MIVWFMAVYFQQYFSYIREVISIGRGNYKTKRKLPTCQKLQTLSHYIKRKLPTCQKLQTLSHYVEYRTKRKLPTCQKLQTLSHYVKYRTKRKLPTCQKLQTLSHYVKYTSIFKGIKFTSSVVIGTDCIGSCKSNYHTIQGHDSPLQLPYWWNSTYLNRCKDTNDFKILLICPSTIIFNHCEEMRNIKVSYLPFQHFNKGREIFRKGN